MKISTLYFGEQEINPATVVTFPAGLPGFEQLTRYKLFHEEGKPTVFWLQSVDDPAVMFSVTEPQRIGLVYELLLSDAEAALLRLQAEEDALVLVILSRQGEEAPVRAHRYSPLVINLRERLGLQKPLPRVQELTLLRALA